MTSGRPCLSPTAYGLEFRPARCVGEQPLFEQAGGGAVGLEMGDVEHQLLGLRPLVSQLGQDAIEHAQPAPADEPV